MAMIWLTRWLGGISVLVAINMQKLASHYLMAGIRNSAKVVP
jgi:hypothetical protein